MWNINGLSKWKRSHIEMINMINNNDITLIVETWTSDQECELIKQDNLENFTILYKCRRMNKLAKRNSGGIVIFVKNIIRDTYQEKNKMTKILCG